MEAKRERRALSIGVVGNAADVFPELLDMGLDIDIVTDQTSAHDPLVRVRPLGVRPRRGGPSCETTIPTGTSSGPGLDGDPL
jgi:urocanate hydratase